MAIAAAHSLAEFAQKRGIDPDNIIPTMDETDVFKEEAASVAMQAIKDGVARLSKSWKEVYNMASQDINYARDVTQTMMQQGLIKTPSNEMLQEALEWTIEQIK
jgi:malate dehydrogenase (oxaloacetate-decarboxylating)